MARLFNGTSDKGSRAIDLSSYSLISIGFWLWWDTFANNDKLALEYTPTINSNAGFIVDVNSSAPANGAMQIGFTVTAGGVKAWVDSCPRPTAAAWHQFLIVMNRATPANLVWIDGVAQTLSLGTHTAGTYGNFLNSTLNIMSRNGASLFGAGRMAELTIWGGVALGANHALGLTAGASPKTVAPDSLIFYSPLYGGDSPEPDYAGTQKSVTITGTTAANHPRVQPGLLLP